MCKSGDDIYMKPITISVEITEKDYEDTFLKKPKTKDDLQLFADMIKVSIKDNLTTLYYGEDE